MPETNVRDRDYFDALRDQDDGTYVSSLVRGRIFAKTNFNLVRRRTGAKAGFDGLVIVTIYPSYFIDFWRGLATAPDAALGLMRRDGVILARVPALEIGRLPPDTPMVRAVEAADSGTMRAIAADGDEHFFAFRKIGHFDAYGIYTIGTEAALAPWRKDLSIYGAFILVFAAALFSMSGLALQRAKHEQTATKHWHHTAADLEAEMKRRADAEAQVTVLQKMEALGEIAGAVAHDFNNLLTIIVGNLELLQGRLGDAKLERRIENAIKAAELSETATRSLLAFARRQPMQMEDFDLSARLRDLHVLLRQVVNSNIELTLDLVSDGWTVHCDPDQLALAVLNLATNARDAMPTGGALRISTRNVLLRGFPNGLEGEFVALMAEDTGRGMPPETASRALEPFFTTKPTGRGTGLGLSQVNAMSRQCGGTTTIKSAEGRGTAVTIYLPRGNELADALASDGRGRRAANG